MFKNLGSEQIEKVISENIIGRLGCHTNDEIYVVPISYAYDGEYLYARSFEGMKISIMRKNPKVCFQVDTMKDMADWNSVILWGTFEELTNEKDRNLALDKLMSRPLPEVSTDMVKFSEEWPFPTSDYKSIKGIVYRILVTKKTVRLEMLDPEEFRQ